MKYNIKGARYAELGMFINAMATGRSWYQLLGDHEYKYIQLVMSKGPRGRGGYEEVEYLEVLGKKFMVTLDRDYIRNKLIDLKKSYGNRAKDASSSVDHKAISHAVRVINEVDELLTKHTITFPLKSAEYIKHIKAGKEPLEDTLQYIAMMVDKVDYELRTTSLPEKIAQGVVDRTVLGYVI